MLQVKERRRPRRRLTTSHSRKTERPHRLDPPAFVLPPSAKASERTDLPSKKRTRTSSRRASISPNARKRAPRMTPLQPSGGVVPGAVLRPRIREKPSGRIVSTRLCSSSPHSAKTSERTDLPSKKRIRTFGRRASISPSARKRAPRMTPPDSKSRLDPLRIHGFAGRRTRVVDIIARWESGGWETTAPALYTGRRRPALTLR